jgi:hypothetical protein
MAPGSYLGLLDGMGRQLRAGTAGRIPPSLESIPVRLQVSAGGRPEAVARFGRRSHRAAGLAGHMEAEAHRLGVTRLHGLPRSRAAFAPPPCRRVAGASWGPPDPSRPGSGGDSWPRADEQPARRGRHFSHPGRCREDVRISSPDRSGFARPPQ